MHVHDLANYFETPVKGGHVFTHTIHSLRFGPQIPDLSQKKLNAGAWTNHHVNPLDDTEHVTSETAFNFMYFIKVVSTSYLPLGYEHDTYGGNIYNDHAAVGNLGHQYDGSIETHQYSVTSHKRSLNGGDDSAEGHKEKIHARGGIPGVFFSYVRIKLPC